MDLWYEENIDDLFSNDESIDSVAMSFFSAIGHTCASTPLYTDRDPMHFVYGTLATKTVLSPSDRSALLLAKSISLLFIMDGSVFVSAKNNIINYFAVDLFATRGNRSVAASEIQMVVARIVASNTVIFFRNEDAYMLSFSLKNPDGKGSVVFSDWFSAGSHDDCFYESLAAFNFSFASANAFYADFCQAVARHYYTYPCSRELARYEILPAILGTENEREYLTRDDLSDMVRNILLKPINDYGEDYIDEFISDYSSDEFDDIDFDLLEYELEQMGAFDDDFQDTSFEDEIELAAQASSTQNPSFDSSGIPANIMCNPDKLLAWLDEHDNEPNNDVETRPTLLETISSEDLLLEALELEDLDYIDNRSKGGVFWIVGGPEISLFIDDLSTKLGYVFTFKAGGGRATTGEDAWWSK
ncbi:hypothetical protein SDC9_44340 [bioreactor metagenome]|uniref:Uncharacterized protein n=1 Tax=bioreactor metagenome TaxID=1076179 RepID=A0A644W3W4_9ZZZZ